MQILSDFIGLWMNNEFTNFLNSSKVLYHHHKQILTQIIETQNIFSFLLITTMLTHRVFYGCFQTFNPAGSLGDYIIFIFRNMLNVMECINWVFEPFRPIGWFYLSSISHHHILVLSYINETDAFQTHQVWLMVELYSQNNNKNNNFLTTKV